MILYSYFHLEKSMREWLDSIEIPVQELEIEGNIIK